jgi:hypothetical protein
VSSATSSLAGLTQQSGGESNGALYWAPLCDLVMTCFWLLRGDSEVTLKGDLLNPSEAQYH